MNYDVNGYAVTAKFFGNEVCVAYRKHSNFRYYPRPRLIINVCTSACFTDKETETYERERNCSPSGCGGGVKTLQFVVTDSSSKSTVSSFIVFVICAFLSLGFAS